RREATAPAGGGLPHRRSYRLQRSRYRRRPGSVSVYRLHGPNRHLLQNGRRAYRRHRRWRQVRRYRFDQQPLSHDPGEVAMRPNWFIGLALLGMLPLLSQTLPVKKTHSLLRFTLAETPEEIFRLIGRPDHVDDSSRTYQ